LSRLTELIAQVVKSDPALADDLRREVEVLSSRRQFGLNFERHVPESVRLPSRKIRNGDKVVFRDGGDSSDQTWIVVGFEGHGADRKARLVLRMSADQSETRTVPVADCVVVAEFRDAIYPGLRSTGVVQRGGDKPYHAVINGENYHVLQALRFAYEGQVDCVYIDPPYNTRDKDWKYNNNYVEAEDAYRHSKWLAMMERRLLVAKDLLNPEDSVLVVTIDEHEVHRLRLLLEQTFPEATVQMVTIVVNPKGVAQGRFARVEEYALYCFFGAAGVSATHDDLLSDASTQRNTRFWKGLLRAGTNARPSDGLGMVYPIFIDPERSRLVSLGRTLRERIAENEVEGDPNDWVPGPATESESPEGTVAVWPLRKDGSLGVWQAIPDTLLSLTAQGLTKCVRRPEGWAISYVPSGVRSRIESGEISIRAYDEVTRASDVLCKRWV
jgi:adenine-specific DNA-methyltransferase